MKHLHFCCISLVGLLLGCNRSEFSTDLARRAASLKPGITRSDVDHIFANMGTTNGKTQSVFHDAVLFTNTPPNLMVVYWPTNVGYLSQAEFCNVFFDSNGTIVAYKYMIDRSGPH